MLAGMSWIHSRSQCMGLSTLLLHAVLSGVESLLIALNFSYTRTLQVSGVATLFCRLPHFGVMLPDNLSCNKEAGQSVHSVHDCR